MRYRIPTLSYQRAAELLTYDASTGVLSWRRPTRTQKPRAGCFSPKLKYRSVGIDGEYYYEHRVAWLLHYGSWPDGYVDHINGDKLDNRISNLRVCDKRQNIANAGPKKTNKLGVKGVYRRDTKFRACIRVSGKTRNLGTFATVEDAAAAYREAAARVFGEFAKSS
jgi:hypothetical protein